MNKRLVNERHSKFNQNWKSRPNHSIQSFISLIVATIFLSTNSINNNVFAFVSKYRSFRSHKSNISSYRKVQHLMFSKTDNRDRKNNSPDKNKFSKYEQREKADMEIARLSKELKLTVPQLRTQLKKNRPKMEGEKAILVDYLLKYSSKNEKNQINNTSTHQPTKKKLKKEENSKKKVIRPTRLSSRTNKSKEEIMNAQTRIANSIKDPSLLTNEYFSSRTDMHPSSRRAVLDILGLTKMTEVQAKTFAAASSGKDVLARARTGTGKTLAFLLPAIEVILQNTDTMSRANIGVLVVSPTRELATQIGDQASSLITFHEHLSVQVVFGGTKIAGDINKMSRRIPSILVATPGRLLDHLESTKINGRPFSDIVSYTKVLILDETDRLLDMGFRREIKKITNYLPRKRQTLLFSATIPNELKNIMSETMREDSITVDCINDGDGSSHTNSRVKQTHVILPTMDRFLSAVVDIVTNAMEDYQGDEHVKMVVFFSTARTVGFFSDLFNKGLQIPVIELHSKKSQSYRNRASDQFRQAKSGILFTSDVSARGVDYPDVTHVIQFGIPDSREQYIHRLGRTGRAGKEGKGLLVLAPYESIFLSELKNLEIPINKDIANLLNSPPSEYISDKLNPVLHKIHSGDKDLSHSARMAYQAFLGYYLGQIKRTSLRSKEEVVSIANNFSSVMGLSEIPALEKRLIGKMGLNGVSGVQIQGGGNTKHQNFEPGNAKVRKRRGSRGGRR